MNIIVDTRGEIAGMTTEQLYLAFQEAAETTARHIVRLAVIWSELERRGEDMSRFRSGLAAYLPAVANGRLVPEAIVKLAGNRTALRAIACLDPDTQRLVLGAGTLTVAQEEGGPPVEIKLQHLKPAEVNRAVDAVNGRLIPPAEQRIAARRVRTVHNMARVIVPLTSAERDALVRYASQKNKSAADLVREALVDARLLS